VDVPLPDYVAALAAGRSPEDAVRGTRIGLPDRYFFELLDPEVERAVRDAARTFERLGAVVEEIAVPEGIEELYEGVYRPVMRPEAYAYHTDQGWLRERADRYSPEVRANIERGAEVTAADYIRAQQRRRAFTDAMRAVLAKVDALLTPTLPIPAPPVDAYDAAFVANGRAIPNGALWLTFPFDLTGQPALSIPCGFTQGGLPVGAQLVAGHFNEGTLLRLGHAYQRATDWHTRRPALG
jgi:Asp-tRNA(Asn)/Glu-tRNA(Gln) amidotransferase A subunit family amidase